MASIVTFDRNSVFQEQVIVRFYDDSSGLFIEQTRLEIQYGEYEALSLSSGFVSVRQKSTLEYLLYEQPFDFYRMDSVGFPIWGPDSANTVFMLSGEIGGGASGSTPPPAFAFTQFVANGTTITPDTTTDILTITPGTGISITGNSTTDTITFANTGIVGLSASLPITRSLGSSPTIGIEDATTSSSGAMTASDKTKLDGIAAGAEVNQNAFSNVAVAGQSTIESDGKTDTLTLVAGSNVTITTDAGSDSITIASSKPSATTASIIQLNEASNNGSNYVALQAPVSLGGNTTWTLPLADGLANQAIITDGSGNLDWLDVPNFPQFMTGSTTASTSYTLSLSDAGRMIIATASSAVTVTVPTAASVGFEQDVEISFMQKGTGQITIAGASGVNIRTTQTLKTSGQYAVIAIKKIDTDEWVCVGDREAL